MPEYDLIVIGGGAAGFGTAIKANDLGAKTAFVHAGLPLGGTCVNVGCVPSKRLLWAAEVLHTATHHGIPGLELSVSRLDVAAIVRDELALVQQLREEKYAAVLRGLEHLTFVEGRARFTGPHSIDVNGRTLSSTHIVIATGSTATVPPVPGLRDVGFWTHVEALQHAASSLVDRDRRGPGWLGIRPVVRTLGNPRDDPAARVIDRSANRARVGAAAVRDPRRRRRSLRVQGGIDRRRTRRATQTRDVPRGWSECEHRRR